MVIKIFALYKKLTKTMVNKHTMKTYNTLTTDKLLDLLEKRFPDCWFKDASLFKSNYQGVWTGEGSYIEEVIDTSDNTMKIPAFDMYGHHTIYEMGVHKQLVAFLDQFGLYAEAYDSGTFFIFISTL